MDTPRVTDLLMHPPRDMTPQLLDAEKLIQHSTSNYSKIWQVILGQYVFMGLFAILLFALPKIPVAVPVGFMSYAVVFNLVAMLFKRRHYRRIRRLVVHGDVVTITVHENLTNWSTQVNDTPQRIIVYDIDGEIRKYKLYDHNMADAFDGPTPVLIHPDLKFIIPVAFLENNKISKI